MRVVVTGASGFGGRQLVPKLRARGVSLLLVGRDPATLSAIFPGCDAVAYDDLPDAAIGYDLILHLAALNGDQNGTYEAFERVNVDHALATSAKAQQAGVRRFIYVSSTHALDHNNISACAESPRAVVRKLEAIDGLDLRVLYLPAVLGDRFAGKLAILNKFPGWLRRAAISVLAALKPTVHIDLVLEAVLALGGDTLPRGATLVVTNGQESNVTFRNVKRLLDLAFALAVIVLLWWAMIIIWAAIRLQSPGPGIFRQKRVGINEGVFTCYKFRTMFVSTPDAGTHEVAASSVTPFGRFLRRTKLDELPQVFNILMNQMSLVGPRPCLPSQSELITERRSLMVFRAKPGITGWAQVNNIDMSDPANLARWDQQYILLQSILFDLRIILQTALGKGGGDNVR